METNHKNHDHTAACSYCPPRSNKPIISPNAKTKIMSFLGVCGCISCYVAMFPAILLGVIGILGLSQLSTIFAFNVYAASALFQPILVVSITFLIVGIIRYGKAPLLFAILGGISIFVRMNFYMREWLFTVSFALVTLSYFLAYRKTKSMYLGLSIFLLLLIVIIGAVDTGRLFPVGQSAKSASSSGAMDQMMK